MEIDSVINNNTISIPSSHSITPPNSGRKRKSPSSKGSAKNHVENDSNQSIDTNHNYNNSGSSTDSSTNSTIITRRSPRSSRKACSSFSSDYIYETYFPSVNRTLSFSNPPPDVNTIIYSEKSQFSGEYNLYIVTDSLKGFCVYSSDYIPANSYICEYAGELLTEAEATLRNINYSINSVNRTDACYLYYFACGNKTYCIDSTVDNSNFTAENPNSLDMRFGYAPYLNHSRIHCNITPLKKKNNSKNSSNHTVENSENNNKPRVKIVFYSNQAIVAHTELLFDYGDRSEESRKHFPWLDS